MQSNSPYFSRIEWHGIAKLNIGPAIQRPCNRTHQRAVVNFVERINQQNVRPHPTANTELPSKHPQAFVLSTRKVEVTHTNITATAANAVMIVRSKLRCVLYLADSKMNPAGTFASNRYISRQSLIESVGQTVSNKKYLYS